MKEYISESIQAKKDILKDENLLKEIEKVVLVVFDALQGGKKLLFVGNGGSASDCNHLSTEFVSRFCKERHALRAVSLTANNSLLTAIANDYGFEKVFSRQIESLGEQGDILLAFSTSGNSENIIQALKTADEKGLIKIGFSGSNLSEMDSLCDIILKVPSSKTPIIQESHIMLGHLICKMVEDRI